MPSVGWMTSPVPDKPPQHSIGSPVFGELRRRLGHIRRMILELGLEPLQEGKSIRSRPRKSDHHPAVGQAANFVGIGLHDRIAEAYLPIAAERNAIAVTNGQDCSTVKSHVDSWQIQVLLHRFEAIVPDRIIGRQGHRG
jgi:hypothetical protein